MLDRCIYQTGSVLPVREIGSNFVNNSLTVPQKVWCPLNNAGSLHLNQFDVKITDLEDKLDKERISVWLPKVFEVEDIKHEKDQEFYYLMWHQISKVNQPQMYHPLSLSVVAVAVVTGHLMAIYV